MSFLMKLANNPNSTNLSHRKKDKINWDLNYFDVTDEDIIVVHLAS